MNTLETIKSGAAEFSQPFTMLFAQTVDFVPLLLGSLFVLVLGLIIAPIVGNLVTRFLHLVKIDRGMDLTGAKDAFASIGLNFTLSKIVGDIVKYLVLIVFLINAAHIIGLGQLSVLIEDIIRFIPQIVVALIILGVGLTVAEWLREVVANMAKVSDNQDYAGVLSSVTRISVIVFAVMAALAQVGIAPVLIQIMFAGVVFALALAFGLGAKDMVARTLEEWLKK